jgi:exonuclease III
VEDTYARIDYILASPAMARRVVRAQTYIPALANWGLASDHRPVLATFTVTGDP